MKLLKSLKGFTLIELIITITIVAILAVVTIPVFINLMESSEKVAVQQLVAGLNTARMLFISKVLVCNQNYPSVENAYLGFFVKLSGAEGNMQCGGPWHTFQIESARNALAKNPSTNILVSPREIVINTKTGRTVTITQDATTNDITWTASPAY